jgi:hypothetical protein
VLLDQIIENIFQDDLKRVTVISKKKEEKVLIITKENFFRKLHALNIIKKANLNENLLQFLRFDQQYASLILFKKLVKAIEIFNTNNLFNSIGTKRISIISKSQSGVP